MLRRGFVLTESCEGLELLFAVQTVEITLLGAQTCCLGRGIISLRWTSGRVHEISKMIVQALLRAELLIGADHAGEVLYMSLSALMGSKFVDA